MSHKVFMRRKQMLLSPAMLCGALIIATCAVASSPHPITIDGRFDDWTTIPTVYEADISPGETGLAVEWMKIAHDERFVFFKMKLTEEINLNEGHPLWLYLDTDHATDTGIIVNGIGADLAWRFGERRGFYYGETPAIQISHYPISLRSAPSVTSDRFEFAIARDAVIAGHNVFIGDSFRMLIYKHFVGPIFPAMGDEISYTFIDASDVSTETLAITRELASDLRIASFNVWFDGLWDPSRADSFARILQATQPDIIHFQEIYNHTTTQTIAFINNVLPLESGHSWYGAKVSDCVTVSRYPITHWFGVASNLAVLVDTSDAIGSSQFMINAHLPCCTNDTGRQFQADSIMATIRSAKQAGGAITLEPNTPIMISGDLNLVGLSQQLTTLLEGEIVDQSTFGPPFDPDWDGTHLTSVWPRQTEKRMGYTWQNPQSQFWPGHLDYHIYSDSVLELGNSYTLFTPNMSPDILAQHGLEPLDSLASDHLLFIADFRTPTETVPGDITGNGSVGVDDLLILLNAWGECAACDNCIADINSDCAVDVDDLLILLNNWG